MAKNLNFISLQQNFAILKNQFKKPKNLKFYKRFKYIKIIYYFIKKAIKNNIIKVFYIKSKDNIINSFIKLLNFNKFNIIFFIQ